MADDSVIRPEEATLSGAEPDLEARELRDLVLKHVHLPDDVLRVDVHLGNDSTGAPAVWIAFVAHDDLKPSKNKIEKFQRAADEARAAVFNSGSMRWPYVEITTETE